MSLANHADATPRDPILPHLKEGKSIGDAKRFYEWFTPAFWDQRSPDFLVQGFKAKTNALRSPRMKASVVEMEEAKGEEEEGEGAEGEHRHQHAHPLPVQDLKPEVAWQNCAPLEEQVQHVDHHEGHGDVKEVHAHLAEYLNLKPQLIEFP